MYVTSCDVSSPNHVPTPDNPRCFPPFYLGHRRRSAPPSRTEAMVSPMSARVLALVDNQSSLVQPGTQLLSHPSELECAERVTVPPPMTALNKPSQENLCVRPLSSGTRRITLHQSMRKRKVAFPYGISQLPCSSRRPSIVWVPFHADHPGFDCRDVRLVIGRERHPARF